MNSWEETMGKLIEHAAEAQPQEGQVWVLRRDDFLVQILDPESKLPEKVVVTNVESAGWGKFSIKVRSLGQQYQDVVIDSFQNLYELHRPTLWERLTQRT